MKKMTIYEPAMCCSTGVCGVGVDPELMRISTVLNNLKKSGVVVDRYNLSSAPNEFMQNDAISALIIESGIEALPAVVVDGEIAITGRYPSNEELVMLLDIPKRYLGAEEAEATDESSGCKGGSCQC